MLKILTCECTSATPLVQQLLRRTETPNWMDIPVHKGKEHCRTVLSYFPDPYKELLSFRALYDYLENASSFAIVVGYDDTTFYWADIHSNAPADVLQAEAILKRFA